MSRSSPTASSSSESFSYSPSLMSSDLGLDPSDPLNLLLHNTSQSTDSSMEDSSSSQSEGESPPDWSQLSSLWPENNADQSGAAVAKSYADLMDFTDLSSLPMDIDFNQSLSIDPSALQFDPMKFANSVLHYPYDNHSAFNSLGNDLLSTQFPFTFDSTSLDGSGFSSSSSPSVSSSSPSLSSKERRLSITSFSSSSGASFSPAPDSSPSPGPAGYTSDASQQNQQTQNVPLVEESAASFANDPVAELAQRVRQSAGVMLAVPMGAQLQGHGINQQVSIPITNTTQAKLPIPRLPRHNIPASTKSSGSSSAASTPPPSTPPLSSALGPQLSINTAIPPPPSSSSVPTPTTAVPTSAAPRPKTSHTTIERRYRTNLNARIQSLRMAVPALRVLEDREGNGKKIKKNVRGGIPVKGSPEAEDSFVDVIDERGFVDGVKVARKCSKANVLGKAVEYIRVLKRREMRLKSEQAGLKMLVSGLVGGPALLREWEREWRERFGGEEKDEVEGEPDAEGDDEDSEEGEDDGEEETGRKRKRGKISTSSSTAAPAVKRDEKPVKEKKPPAPQAPLEPGAVPEKRKRGRPRKVVSPPVPVAPPAPIVAQPEPVQQDQTMFTPSEAAQQWAQVQQQQPQQYLLAVFALFSFFNSPFTSSSSSAAHHHHTGMVLTPTQPPLAYAPDIISQFVPAMAPAAAVWGWKEYMQVFHLLVSVLVLLSFVGSWTGITWGKSKRKRDRSMSVSSFSLSSNEDKVNRIKQGEQCVLGGTVSELSMYDRFQIYRAISSSKNTPVGEQATIAMVVWGAGGVLGGLGRTKARVIWEAAKTQAEAVHMKAGSALKVKGSEKLVFDELDVDAAVARLEEVSSSSTPEKLEGDDGRAYTPIDILGCSLVHERVKKHLGSLFVDSVNVGEQEKEKEQEEKEQAEIRRTVDVAKELGGRVGELGRILERVWKTPASVSLGDTAEIQADEEVKALLTALVLYRQVFASSGMAAAESTLLSPPPSPKGKEEGGKVYELRRALGSRVFEEGELEDAKDRVVDLVVDSERKGRAGTP